MSIILLPPEIQSFVDALAERYPCKVPFRLSYLWGHGELLPAIEGGLQRHDGYWPDDSCAVVMGVNPDDWDNMLTADGSLYYKSRDHAIRETCECIAHEYAHHLQHEMGVLPYQPSEQSEEQAEKMAADMLNTILGEAP